MDEKFYLEGEKYQLERWFDDFYTRKEQKYRRLHLLNKRTDENNDPLEELKKLYVEAETKRKRIQEIEKLLK